MMQMQVVKQMQMQTPVATPNMIRYTFEDFKTYMFDECLFKLSNETMTIIQAIADQVGDPEYIKTPQFPKRDNGKKNSNSNGSMDENWKSVRHAQIATTVIVKKEGIYASIDAVRKYLNKMTDKTYDATKQNIIDELKKIVGDASEVDDELLTELNKVGNAIFAIASGNSFYSEMYAKLYKDLMDTFPFMKIIFQKNFDEFNLVFKTVEYVDPEADYDKFCDINKINEKRRSLSLFYVNLMKNDVIEKDKVVEIMMDLQRYMNELMIEKDNKNVVEELSEVVYIMVTKGHSFLKQHSKWGEIKKDLVAVSKLKVKDRASLSNKTVFKYMDMIDMI
jgi:hypothetical protein